MKDKKKYIYYLIIIALLIYILFLDESSFLQKFRLKKKLVDLQEDINMMKDSNQKLRNENKLLKKDAAILEKKARKLGMQKKGDEIFLFKKKVMKKENSLTKNL